MKIGFTGSQSGMTQFQKKELHHLIELLEVSEFCHGDCIGSDQQANEIALDAGVKVFSIFTPSESKKRAFCFNSERDLHIDDYQWRDVEYKGIKIKVRWFPKDTYLNRNRHMVDNVSRLIATPKEHQHTLRSGTWSTIRYAWKLKRDVTVIPPMADSPISSE